MIAAAQSSLELAGFYISNQEGSRLEPVLAQIEQAGARVAGCAFVIELAALDGRSRLTGHDVFSLIHYD